MPDKTTPPKESVNDDKLENTEEADAARALEAAQAKEAKQKEEKQRTHSPHFLSRFTPRRPLLPRAIPLKPHCALAFTLSWHFPDHTLPLLHARPSF